MHIINLRLTNFRRAFSFEAVGPFFNQTNSVAGKYLNISVFRTDNSQSARHVCQAVGVGVLEKLFLYMFANCRSRRAGVKSSVFCRFDRNSLQRLLEVRTHVRHVLRVRVGFLSRLEEATRVIANEIPQLVGAIRRSYPDRLSDIVRRHRRASDHFTEAASKTKFRTFRKIKR